MLDKNKMWQNVYTVTALIHKLKTNNKDNCQLKDTDGFSMWCSTPNRL